MSSNTKYTENDIRATYAKLRELTKDAAPPVEKLAEIEAQVKIIDAFRLQNRTINFTKNEDTLYAEMALAEGHVELFEKVCDWCKLESVKEESELGQWKQCCNWLYLSITYSSAYSIKLATILFNSKRYIKVMGLKLRSYINSENELLTVFRNARNRLDEVPNAVGAFRTLYTQILEIYKSKKYVYSVLFPLRELNRVVN